MFVPFDDLSEEARVWVYQLNRELTDVEKSKIELVMKDFCSHWQAHGAPLRTSFQIAHNYFLILAVDENAGNASGCSIDGSVRVLKELGTQLNVDFFDRTKAAFLIDNKVQLYPIAKLKDLFNEGALNAIMPMFDNLVATKSSYLKNWQVPIAETWLSKYLPKGALA
jgi:hypothetical protein